MDIVWKVDRKDIAAVKQFVEKHEAHPLVRHRSRVNLASKKKPVSKAIFWKRMASCLLTSQQRSGPGSAVAEFVTRHPFPLAYRTCVAHDDVETFAGQVLRHFPGLRFKKRLSAEIGGNFGLLQGSIWPETRKTLETLLPEHAPQAEKAAADFIEDHFSGFGPKQSRNLLQVLGLTKYEVPLDSRITKWLRGFGFPVALSPAALSDRNYYHFVSDGFQQLCAKGGVYPCLLDAAIFASFDSDWPENLVLW